MADEFPALAAMLRVFGSRPGSRNRATMGGNLVTASPIGDSAPILLGLDATVVLPRGRANVPLSRRFPLWPIEKRRFDMVKSLNDRRAALSCTSKLRRTCRWYKVSKAERWISASGCLLLCGRGVANASCVRRGPGVRGSCRHSVRAHRTEQASWENMEPGNARVSVPILEREFVPISDVRGSKEYRLL